LHVSSYSVGSFPPILSWSFPLAVYDFPHFESEGVVSHRRVCLGGDRWFEIIKTVICRIDLFVCPLLLQSGAFLLLLKSAIFSLLEGDGWFCINDSVCIRRPVELSVFFGFFHLLLPLSRFLSQENFFPLCRFDLCLFLFVVWCVFC